MQPKGLTLKRNYKCDNPECGVSEMRKWPLPVYGTCRSCRIGWMRRVEHFLPSQKTVGAIYEAHRDEGTDTGAQWEDD